jgi:DNA polymerase III subunit epsilon
VKGFAQALLAHPDLVILDTETTDLNGYLVQIAVLRASDGAVLLDTLVNPCCAISPEAQRVHGITAEQTTGAPKFVDIEKALREALSGKLVAIYNADFDLGILRREVLRMWEEAGVPDTDPAQGVDDWFYNAAFVDVMLPYSAWIGDWNDRQHSYKWQRLPGGDHTALGDCHATLAVLRRMATED